MVRPFRLARIALSAELLRLRHQVRRAISRAILGMIALALLFGALLFGHVAGWYWLRQDMSPQLVALIFMGVDLLLALIVAGVAISSSPGEAERSALAVRESALEDVAESVSVSALLIRLFEVVMASRPRR
jgi:MFS family permease